MPKRISLANLPTRIEPLERLSKHLGGPKLYIKRDDQTGTELSGNKVRKLEFSIAEALEQGCDMLITCGGIQSNHCRATAAAAAKLGLHSYLVLRAAGNEKIDGNHFIDILLGARIRYITREQYAKERMAIMEGIKADMEKEGYKPYIIPEGASNGIGSFGYLNAMQEIAAQEAEMKVHFDAIVLAVGSGGTQAGLLMSNKILNRKGMIYGVNVCDDAEYFKKTIARIMHESFSYLDEAIPFTEEDICILDGYVGRGYALSQPDELAFIRDFAQMEGIILDPVYTGKAMYGLAQEIRKGTFRHCENILFIHTGGLYGLFPTKDQFEF